MATGQTNDGCTHPVMRDKKDSPIEDTDIEKNVNTLNETDDSSDNNKHNPETNHPIPTEEETNQLRNCLRLYFYSAIKWKQNTCSIHIIYSLIFILQIITVAIVTAEMFQFGSDRQSFTSIVNRGHITLRHLMLKNWDSTWETLPYPPSRGEFALYDIQHIEDSTNFAVKQYFNAEQESTAFFKRKNNDTMNITMKYFDLNGFDGSDTTSEVNVQEKTFAVEKGLNLMFDAATNTDIYTYNVTKEFEHQNLSQPIKRLLNLTLTFSIHSVRIFEYTKLATCLHIYGWVSFVDQDKNGQVIQDLDTLTTKIDCRKINYSLSEWDLERSSVELRGVVLGLSSSLLLVTALGVAFAGYVFCKTKNYMYCCKYYYHVYNPQDDDETDLPIAEYLKFINRWDLVTIISNICNIIYSSSIFPTSEKPENLVIATFDKQAVLLSVGCFFAWLSLLRFFKFHNKFNLLFSTLYRAFLDVLAYLVCVMVLFVGFYACGYVVLGPYHVKFAKPYVTAETLFSIIYGDEMFTTLNYLEAKKAGSPIVWWFSRLYIGTYVAIFTLVVINILIAIFLNAYEAIKKYYAEDRDDRDLSPVEKAIRRYLANTKESAGTAHGLRASFHELLSDKHSLTTDEHNLRVQLEKLVRITGKSVELLKPRTLKAFMNDGDDSISCGCFSFSFLCPCLCKKCGCKK